MYATLLRFDSDPTIGPYRPGFPQLEGKPLPTKIRAALISVHSKHSIFWKGGADEWADLKISEITTVMHHFRHLSVSEGKCSSGCGTSPPGVGAESLGFALALQLFIDAVRPPAGFFTPGFFMVRILRRCFCTNPRESVSKSYVYGRNRRDIHIQAAPNREALGPSDGEAYG